MRIREMFALGAAVAASACLGQPAPAYPAKPIRAIVGFAAGGNTDIAARVIGKKAGELLGQAIIIENRPGAGGSLAMEAAASAPADGYTLLVGTLSSHVLHPASVAHSRVDPGVAFTPVALTNQTPIYLGVASSLRAGSIGEFIARARMKPGSFSYGAPSAGGVGHLAAVLFNRQAGIAAEPIIYKGSSPATVDLAAGTLQYMFDGIAAFAPHVAAGRVSVLAVSGDRRQPDLPNVPTFAEAGYPEMSALLTWNAWFVPAATPPQVVSRLNSALVQALADPEVAKALRQAGNDVFPSMPSQDVSRFMAAERKRWLPLLQQAGIKPE
jgi:tripartite-type tricarboxylate transporter receptor subunit TctC